MNVYTIEFPRLDVYEGPWVSPPLPHGPFFYLRVSYVTQISLFCNILVTLHSFSATAISDRMDIIDGGTSRQESLKIHATQRSETDLTL